MTRSLFAASAALLLAGCAGNPPPLKAGDLRAPNPALMQKAPALPEYKEGDDYKAENAKLRALYGEAVGQVDGLQGYVRTIRKPK